MGEASRAILRMSQTFDLTRCISHLRLDPSHVAAGLTCGRRFDETLLQALYKVASLPTRLDALGQLRLISRQQLHTRPQCRARSKGLKMYL